MLDSRISLLAEALDVQREGGVDGVFDNTGGLLDLLMEACFRRRRGEPFSEPWKWF